MIVINDRRQIKPEKEILKWKKMLLKVLWMALIAPGLVDNDEKSSF